MKLKTILHELETVEWADNKDKSGSVRNANDVLDHFGDNADIRSIEYGDVIGFTKALKVKGLGGCAINRKLAALSKMFTIAARHDPRIKRPEIPRQKESKPRQRVLKAEEAEALIAWDWKYPSHRDLTVLFMDTGVRPGEITKGEWELDGDTMVLRDTKNGDDRFLILTPAAQAAAARLKALPAMPSYSTYSKCFVRARAALGLEDVVVYTIRHTALTNLAERIDNPLLIQKWAGHKNLATTQRYVKATRQGMQRLADALKRS
jgi:integrase